MEEKVTLHEAPDGKFSVHIGSFSVPVCKVYRRNEEEIYVRVYGKVPTLEEFASPVELSPLPGVFREPPVYTGMEFDSSKYRLSGDIRIYDLKTY